MNVQAAQMSKPLLFLIKSGDQKKIQNKQTNKQINKKTKKGKKI